MLKPNAKRFFEAVDVARVEDGFAVKLDDRPVRTPEGSAVVIPTVDLASIVASEWDNQAEVIKPLTMPVTRLVCTAIDKVTPVRETVVEQISAYGVSDLLCYRSESPQDLVERQAAAWQPPLDWFASAFGISLNVTQGIVHVEQPEGSLGALKEVVDQYRDFHLTGLAEVTQLTGSLVLAVSYLEKFTTLEDLKKISLLDDDWQTEKWGEDREAVERRKNLENDMTAATVFIDAL